MQICKRKKLWFPVVAALSNVFTCKDFISKILWDTKESLHLSLLLVNSVQRK